MTTYTAIYANVYDDDGKPENAFVLADAVNTNGETVHAAAKCDLDIEEDKTLYIDIDLSKLPQNTQTITVAVSQKIIKRESKE